jgi:small subunit ribosomal protein S4
MARYTDAVCRLCRRERQKLFLKGAKCYTEKCPVEKRNTPPGMHTGNRRQKVSEYGVQLREKQKIKRIYGLLEGQFRLAFERASSQRGVTGENLLKLLERRLDNIVFRLGFAASRRQARQLIRHGHFRVNSRIVSIPSFLVRPGDRVVVVEKSRTLDAIHDALKRTRDAGLVGWLSLDKAQLTGTVLQIPDRADIPLPANEQLVVELYSK